MLPSHYNSVWVIPSNQEEHDLCQKIAIESACMASDKAIKEFKSISYWRFWKATDDKLAARRYVGKLPDVYLPSSAVGVRLPALIYWGKDIFIAETEEELDEYIKGAVNELYST